MSQTKEGRDGNLTLENSRFSIILQTDNCSSERHEFKKSLGIYLTTFTEPSIKPSSRL